MLLLRLHRDSSDWDWDLLYHLFYLQYLRVCVCMNMRACANSRMNKWASVWWAGGAIHVCQHTCASGNSCKQARKHGNLQTCTHLRGRIPHLARALFLSLPPSPSLPPSLSPAFAFFLSHRFRSLSHSLGALSVHVRAWARVNLSDFNSFGMHAKGDRHILNDCCHFWHFHHNLYTRMHAAFKGRFIFVRACSRARVRMRRLACVHLQLSREQ